LVQIGAVVVFDFTLKN